MNPTKQVFEELRQKYEKQKSQACIHWLPIDHKDSEDFEVSYAGGIWQLKAHSYLGAIYGLQSLQSAISSRQLSDLLGFNRPHFKIRPLWMKESIALVLNDSQKWHVFCSKILELGYNAILIDEKKENNFRAFCKTVKNYGLKIILKPSCQKPASPFDQSFYTSTVRGLKDLPYIDYLFWESAWLHPEFLEDPHSERYTLSEIVLAEAQMLEKNLEESIKIIFYLPASDFKTAQQSAGWMLNFANQLSTRTTLAFPAAAGNIYDDSLPAHPFWNVLCAQIHPTSATFMPLLNVGQVKRSEGLWPILTYDLLDEYFGRCSKGNFLGFLALTNHLPSNKGILDCNLWTAAQTMRSPQKKAFLWTEAWFAAFRADWNYSILSSSLNQIRFLSKQLSSFRSYAIEENRPQLSSQDCRIMAESLLGQLGELQIKLEKEERKRFEQSDKTTLWDYFVHFAYDARKMIFSVMQSFNVSCSINEEEMKESFWTALDQSSSLTRARNGVTFLSKPNKGAPGSRMRQIYKENILFGSDD